MGKFAVKRPLDYPQHWQDAVARIVKDHSLTLCVETARTWHEMMALHGRLRRFEKSLLRWPAILPEVSSGLKDRRLRFTSEELPHGYEVSVSIIRRPSELFNEILAEHAKNSQKPLDEL